MKMQRAKGSIISVAMVVFCLAAVALVGSQEMKPGSFKVLNKQGKKPVVGVSVIGTEHNWDINAYNGAVSRLKAWGVDVIAFDGERKPEKQLADVKTLIARKVDVIAVILGQTQSLSPALKEARASGIPVITADFQDPSSLCNIATNNYAAMAELVLKMVGDLNGEGEVGVFFRPGSPIAEMRKGVFDLVLKSYPKVKVQALEAYVVPGTVPDAYNKTKDMMRANPNIKAFWTLFDMPVIGAAQALADMGLAGKVATYGFDGDPTAMAMIADKNSAFEATVAQQPFLIGQTLADTAIEVVTGKKVPVMKFVPHVLVTRDNVAEVLSTLPQYKK